VVKLSCPVSSELEMRWQFVPGFSSVAYANVWTTVLDVWRRSTPETARSHEFVSSAHHCCA
jgi:hypothetical protein